jgi:5-methyltetrahydrofolate--homocysteine methyltransferase
MRDILSIINSGTGKGILMSDDNINLQDLSTEDLLKKMMVDLYDGLAEAVENAVNECLQRGMDAYEIMTNGLVAGMDIVGVDFRDGILFVPEVLMAAKAMKAGMAILRPLLTETGIPKLGTAVIGTVKGDIHDIGKNLVAMLWEGAGIEVVNIGINRDADSFIAALQEHNADILGMSALLTTTMPYMRVVIDELKARGLRDQYIVLVGGAPLNEAFAEEIEADAYCQDAAVAVETAKAFLATARGKNLTG